VWSVQALLKSLEKKASEAEENFAQAKRESEERLKRAEQAEAKVTETQEALQRYVVLSNSWAGVRIG
jgi:myosin-5